MKIKIVSRWNSENVLFETDAESLGAAIIAALVVKSNLCGADLRGAYLCGANLRGADLCGADLRGANLCGANLRGADLCGANLRDANLRGADLYDADLCGADLCDANLRGANLRGADLRGADLCGAENIRKKALEKLVSARTILPDGDLIGWKKLQGGVICKLQIPAKAERLGGLVGRKCRAEFAIVLAGEGQSQHNGMAYKMGEMVKPDKFDPNPLVECSHGIHFFITKQEAENY